MAVTERTLKVRGFFYLSFRPPELGQPFWSSFLLVATVRELEVLNPKVEAAKSLPSTQPKSLKSDLLSSFSEEEICTRAYQIYECRSRTDYAADDWRQAETELMELVHAK